MITVEERNVTEETKFVIVVRLLYAYIRENLGGIKATYCVKKQEGNVSLRFNICRRDLVFCSDCLHAQNAVDKSPLLFR